MMKLSCKDMGADCDFTVTGDTKEEVMSKMMDHAKMDHADMMAGMTDVEMDKMRNDMMEKIKEE